MHPDFSATNMKIFEIVGKMIGLLARLCQHPDCSQAYEDVDNAFVDFVKERGMTESLARKLTGYTVTQNRSGSAVVLLAPITTNKIKAIKLVRQLTNMGLREAKDLVETKGIMFQRLDPDTAKAYAGAFRGFGAEVDVIEV